MSDKNNRDMVVEIPYGSKKLMVSTIFFCSISTVFIWLIILYVILRPEFYTYSGFASNFVLKKPEASFDPLTLHNIGEMVTSGTLLSVDDFWSFQSNLYQTIITVLIALNAIIAAFSFFIIKSSSMAKAREEARAEAIQEVTKYIESMKFYNDVRNMLNEKIQGFQLDLQSQIEIVEIMKKEYGMHSDTIEKIQRDNTEQQRQIKILASSISLMDKDDDEGHDYVLGKRG